MEKILPTFTLKRSARSRRVRVTVMPGGAVVVSAPRRTPECFIAEFLQSNAPWLREKIEYFYILPAENLSEPEEKKLFDAWREKALALAEVKVSEWNNLYRFSVGKVVIRRSRSRWGSCSSKGTLSFSYKIVFLPEGLLDYLAVHELCHLKEQNHSQVFWSLVAKTIPDYGARRKELQLFHIPAPVHKQRLEGSC